jgi:hypothetical protein
LIPARDAIYVVITTEHGHDFVLPVQAWRDVDDTAVAMVVNPGPHPHRLVTADKAAELIRGTVVELIDASDRPTAAELLGEDEPAADETPGDWRAGIDEGRRSLGKAPE